MTDLQRTARVAELQSYLRTRPRLKLEFLASMSRLFREHNIDLPHEVLAHLTLSLERGDSRPAVSEVTQTDEGTALGLTANPTSFIGNVDMDPLANPSSFIGNADFEPPPNPSGFSDDSPAIT